MKAFGKYSCKGSALVLMAGLFLFSQNSDGQSTDPIKLFRVKDNLMHITLSKNLSIPSLDSFIHLYSLSDLGLYTLMLRGKSDTLAKSGWLLQTSGDNYILTKKIGPGSDLKNSSDMMVFSAIPASENWRVVGGNRIVYGVNRFENNRAFRQEDGITYFFLKGHQKANSVSLAGNFTNWQHAAFPMSKTTEGWEVAVRLKPGQYFYKFIINDHDWKLDPDNYMQENDGLGNSNSVYFVPNKVFFLKGRENAWSVFLSGSFNNWAKLPMNKTSGGWSLPMYLEAGTHTFHYIVDGKIVSESDQESAGKIALGKSHDFVLKGFTDARGVSLAGNFNDWEPRKILMERVAEGWKISYVLGPGNYQYKFIVDGNWITDPENPNIIDDGHGNLNSFMVVEPNYTFRLKGYAHAERVNLAGNFTNWSHQGLVMKKLGDEWVCSVYLGRGKHLYKFIVDGEWIRDPLNPLWEDETENSVLWID